LGGLLGTLAAIEEWTDFPVCPLGGLFGTLAAIEEWTDFPVCPLRV
jgi:hypothetical protein